MMKKFSLLFALLGLVFTLTACGGGGAGGAVSSMTGEWVAASSSPTPGATVEYVLDMQDSGGSLSGELWLRASYQGYDQTAYVNDFTGSRSGSSVEISFYRNTAYIGRLSGKRLTFDNFITSASLDEPITFIKR